MKKTLPIFLLLMMSMILHSQVNLVKNINPSFRNGINSNSQLIAYNDKIVFAGDDSNGQLDFELFQSDGTSSGTLKIKEISSGSVSANPSNFFYWPSTNEIYFDANGGNAAVNFELWKTDGTNAGTIKISEFDPNGSSNPIEITPYNNKLYMRAREESIGFELFSSDGTLAGSSLFKDIYTGSTSTVVNSSVPDNFINFNGLLFFSANGGNGNELWRTNGTNSGTVEFANINSGGSSFPDNFIIYNNKLYFSANNGANGNELWVTDGTAAGTQLIADINTGSASSDPGNFTIFSNRLYFSATSANFGTELYYMNAAENVTFVRDIASGTLNGNPSNLFIFGGSLYFAVANGVDGRELWKTSGSILSTGMVKDINPSGSSIPENFTEYNGKLYFTATDGTNGTEIWTTDGTSTGTQMITDIANAGAGNSDPQSLIVVNDLLFFHAYGGTSVGRELYTYLDPLLSTSELQETITIKLYPNPVESTFSIDSNSIINTIEIYDVTGKKVKTFDQERASYDISDLVAGIYFIKTYSETGLKTFKITKK